MAAMRLARDNGAAALEFDLHLTAKDELVLNHDPVIQTDAGPVEIAGKSLEKLRQLKPDVATLDEILTEFSDVPLTVEVKARKAAERAARRLADEPGDRPVILTAFKPATVAAAKRAAPGLDTAPAWPTILLFWLLSRVGVTAPVGAGHVALQVAIRMDQVTGLKAIPLVRRLRIADRRFVEAAHRRGLAVHVWTVDEDRDMRAVVAAGADGIFSDRPSRLTNVLDELGVRWTGP
ncbi:MAG: hypothetical protein H0U89_01100 [Acidimicrobiia bacterium]|nr:hypothetical protein [Acidimicrobiia bacterium]